MTMFGKQTEDEQKARKRIVKLAYLSVFLLTLFILLFQLPNMIDAPTLVIYIAEALTGVAGLISFIFFLDKMSLSKHTLAETIRIWLFRLQVLSKIYSV